MSCFDNERQWQAPGNYEGGGMSSLPSSTKSITGFLQCPGPLFAPSLFLMCFSSALGVVELGVPMMTPLTLWI